jgi:DNA-binding Xre family transcriptional regulator
MKGASYTLFLELCLGIQMNYEYIYNPAFVSTEGIGMDIGDIVKQKRTALDWTQTALEEKSGVTQSMISKLESGEAENVSIGVLRKLAKALKCSLIDLLPEQDKTKR